jgi:hypothetical protein
MHMIDKNGIVHLDKKGPMGPPRADAAESDEKT